MGASQSGEQLALEYRQDGGSDGEGAAPGKPGDAASFHPFHTPRMAARWKDAVAERAEAQVERKRPAAAERSPQPASSDSPVRTRFGTDTDDEKESEAAAEEHQGAAEETMEEHVRTVRSLRRTFAGRALRRRQYRDLLGFIAFFVLYISLLSLQRTVSTSFGIIKTLRPLFPQDEKSGETLTQISNLDVGPWLRKLVENTWKDPACGDGVCEEGLEYHAFGRFGCAADCGLYRNLTEVNVQMRAHFKVNSDIGGTVTEATLSAFLEKTSFNLCSTKLKVNGTDLCWWRENVKFESPDELWTRTIQVPDSDWELRFFAPYGGVSGSVTDQGGRELALARLCPSDRVIHSPPPPSQPALATVDVRATIYRNDFWDEEKGRKAITNVMADVYTVSPGDVSLESIEFGVQAALLLDKITGTEFIMRKENIIVGIAKDLGVWPPSKVEILRTRWATGDTPFTLLEGSGRRLQQEYNREGLDNLEIFYQVKGLDSMRSALDVTAMSLAFPKQNFSFTSIAALSGTDVTDEKSLVTLVSKGRVVFQYVKNMNLAKVSDSTEELLYKAGMHQVTVRPSGYFEAAVPSPPPAPPSPPPLQVQPPPSPPPYARQPPPYPPPSPPPSNNTPPGGVSGRRLLSNPITTPPEKAYQLYDSASNCSGHTRLIVVIYQKSGAQIRWLLGDETLIDPNGDGVVDQNGLAQAEAKSSDYDKGAGWYLESVCYKDGLTPSLVVQELTGMSGSLDISLSVLDANGCTVVPDVLVQSSSHTVDLRNVTKVGDCTERSAVFMLAYRNIWEDAATTLSLPVVSDNVYKLEAAYQLMSQVAGNTIDGSSYYTSAEAGCDNTDQVLIYFYRRFLGGDRHAFALFDSGERLTPLYQSGASLSTLPAFANDPSGEYKFSAMCAKLDTYRFRITISADWPETSTIDEYGFLDERGCLLMSMQFGTATPSTDVKFQVKRPLTSFCFPMLDFDAATLDDDYLSCTVRGRVEEIFQAGADGPSMHARLLVKVGTGRFIPTVLVKGYGTTRDYDLTYSDVCLQENRTYALWVGGSSTTGWGGGALSLWDRESDCLIMRSHELSLRPESGTTQEDRESSNGITMQQTVFEVGFDAACLQLTDYDKNLQAICPYADESTKACGTHKIGATSTFFDELCEHICATPACPTRSFDLFGYSPENTGCCRANYFDTEGLGENRQAFTINSFGAAHSVLPTSTSDRVRYLAGKNKIVGGLLVHQVRRKAEECNTAFPYLQKTCRGTKDISDDPFGVDPAFLSTSRVYDESLEIRTCCFESSWNGTCMPPECGDFYAQTYKGKSTLNARGVPYGFFAEELNGRKAGFPVYFDINLSYGRAREFLDYLEEGFYLDDMTKKVTVECYTYNAQVRHFAHFHVIFDWHDGGWIEVRPGTETLNVELYDGRDDYVRLGFEVLFVCMVVSQVLFEFWELCESFRRGEGFKGYFKSFWNYVDILSISLSIFCIIGYIRFYFHSQKLQPTNSFPVYAGKYTKGHLLKLTDDGKYLHDAVADLNAIVRATGKIDEYMSLNGFNIFLMILRFLKNCDFQARMGVLTRTVTNAGSDMAHFFVLLLLVILAYSYMAYLTFGTSVEEFSSPFLAFEACFNMMAFGDNSFTAQMNMYAQNAMISLTFYWTFGILVVILLMNFLLAIVVDSFGDIKADATSKQSIPAEVSGLLRSWIDGRRTKKTDRQLASQLELLTEASHQRERMLRQAEADKRAEQLTIKAEAKAHGQEEDDSPQDDPRKRAETLYKALSEEAERDVDRDEPVTRHMIERALVSTAALHKEIAAREAEAKGKPARRGGEDDGFDDLEAGGPEEEPQFNADELRSVARLMYERLRRDKDLHTVAAYSAELALRAARDERTPEERKQDAFMERQDRALGEVMDTLGALAAQQRTLLSEQHKLARRMARMERDRERLDEAGGGRRAPTPSSPPPRLQSPPRRLTPAGYEPPATEPPPPRPHWGSQL